MPIVGSIPGGAGSFDSELNDYVVNSSTNAELTIFLRICFQPVAGGGTIADFNGTQFQVRNWNPHAWQTFTRHYQQEAQRFWEGRFWLVTPSFFQDLDWPHGGGAPTHRPNIWCRFRLAVVSTAQNPHKTIRLARLAPIPSTVMTAGSFRSSDSLYDDHDLGTAVYSRGGRLYRQRTFIHEVGHALGLQHIGTSSMGNEAQCLAAPSTNADVCYGVLPRDRSNILGFGMALSELDGLPWRKRIFQHTGIDENEWILSMRRVYPLSLAGGPGGRPGGPGGRTGGLGGRSFGGGGGFGGGPR